MLAIRMQRTGRKGHAMFRMVVQDSRRTPTSGKVVAQLGSYDPHAKTLLLNKEKASFYLDHGAQPSDRVARLLQTEGLKMPAWVTLSADRQRVVRHADKRKSTRPAEEVIAEAAPVEAAVVDEAPAAEPEAPAVEEPTDEAETESTTAEDVSEAATEAVAEEEPAATADAPDEPAAE